MAYSSPHRPELWKCFTLLILWVLVFRYAAFQRNKCEQFRDIFTKRVEIMHELKTGICYLWDDYGKVLSLTRFANDPFTIYNQLNVSGLRKR